MFFLFFIILLVIIVLNSKLQIKIYNLDISTDRREKIKQDFEIYLEIITFNKIRIFKINAKKLQSKKINLNSVLEKARKYEQSTNKEEIIKNAIKSLKDLELKIIKANIQIELGTEDAAVTAILVGMISGLLGIMLKKQKFEVLPIYQEKNIVNIKLNCIFRVNIIHYIYKTILKGRDKNERKSSDRRTYAYSYE